jgi:multidrug efflux pump subunit AcrA (membrane-fusion protein)
MKATLPSIRKLRYGMIRLSFHSVVVLLVSLVCLPGCGKPGRERPGGDESLPTVSVRVQTAESQEQLVTEEIVGTVRAKLHAALEAKLSGRIDNLAVLLGQRVRAGQLVAHLDAAEIKARLEQAEAGLQQAERDWKRTSSLFEQQAVTRSERDAADARFRVAKAAVAEAQAMEGYVEVLAPFDGVVTEKWANVGDLAAPGKALVDIEDPAALQLEADVPEAIASRIQQDARLAIRVDSMKSELIGTVREIAPIADAASRTFRVKLDLPTLPDDPAAPVTAHSAPGTQHPAFSTPNFLRSGQFARLVLPVGETTSVRVPASAVLLRGQLEILFVVVNQRAQLHLVKTGKRVGDEVEILAGLDAGDSVVISGAAQLADGQAVRAR